MNNDANFENFNSPLKQNEQLKTTEEELKNLENKYKTEIKNQRTHRLSPTNNINNIEEEDKANKDLNHHFKTPSNKKNKRNLDENLLKAEVEKELIKRKNINKEFLRLYAKFRIDRMALEDDNSGSNKKLANNNIDNITKENIILNIINKTWLNQFKNYSQKKCLNPANLNEDYPGQINNQHLILEDDSCLKLNQEKRIIINSKYEDNSTIISQELWHYFVNLFGGGPEIPYNPNKSKNNIYDINKIMTIKKAVHINLFFIPKKQIISNNNNKEPSNNLFDPLNPFQSQDIKNFLKCSENNYKIRKEKIYFNIEKSVKELINYINTILNQHRDKFTDTPLFFGPSFNEGSNTLVENINYRLWIIYTDVSENKIVDLIQEYIYKYEDADFLLNFTQIANNTNNNNISNITFDPFLINNFLENKVIDIFPNKYTKNFKNKNYYNDFEDINLMPVLNIIIEERPYHFEEPKRNYFIRKCNECNHKDYCFIGCQCKKVFYCCEDCKKRNSDKHILKCKIGLFNSLIIKNEKLFKIIKGRKEYYKKNEKEKEKFPILGLSNVGNSCYMNSALQCLFSTKELSEFFLYYFDNNLINKENILGTGGVLTLAYINLLLAYSNMTNNKYISPQLFKTILGNCSSKFEGNEQEDSHEFITYLIDILHEDLNKVKYDPNNNEKNALIQKENNNDEENSKLGWSNFLRRNQSILVDLFYGQLKSCVICPECNYNSINFNSFLSLELSINSDKNYQIINITFIDYFQESPNINFNIILYQNEKKIYFVRKKIANLLNIDLLSFELAIVYDNKIIHIFDLNEEVNAEIISIIAYRINPEFFYSEKNKRYDEIFKNNNVNDKYKIDYENLEYNINKRKEEIIKYNENKNINDDFLSLNLQYTDNLGLDKSIFQRVIIENFLRKKQIKNFSRDEILYLDKNKSCMDIYYEIFKKYVINLVIHTLSSESRNKFIELYMSQNIEKINSSMKKLFNKLFKNTKLSPGKIDFKNNFPNCPFVLFLKNEKYNHSELIPINNDIKYEEILKIFYDGVNFEKNKYNQISQYNSIINNNNSEKEENLKNEDTLTFDEIITQIMEGNDTNNNNDNDINNKKEEEKKGLKGGNENNNDESSDSEKDSEATDNNENENDNEENENENEENELISDNSDKETINLDDEDNQESFNNNILNSYTSPRKMRLNQVELDNILKFKTEKDLNIDRITIVWNYKYIKEMIRCNDINLYNICDKIYEKSTNQTIKLEKLLEEFSKEEQLDKNNLYRCEKCKKELQANKKIEIYHLPKVLIIHLKRFNNNKKIDTMIDFPLDNLDIKNYIKSEDEVTKYDLFGVINHYGSLEYGHYTSFCLNYHDNFWYEYNDRIVNKIQKGKEKETIINKNAYVLFYRAKDINKINWDSMYQKEFEIIDENNLKKFGENLIYLLDNKEKENISVDNNIKEKEEIKEKSENEPIILDDININIDINESNKKEIDDDNFSFKEGMNNRSISNIENDNEKENETDINDENANPLEETPKFKASQNNEENIKEPLSLNDNLNEDNNYQTNKKDLDIINKNGCKTEIKKDDFLNGIKISKSSTIRIMTYFKPRKNENKNKNNIKKKKSDDNNENDLLKYDIFNQSKNYFKLNPKYSKKGIQSVKNKELSLFFLKEITDNKPNNFPRSKKLYEEISDKVEKNTNNEQLNNVKEEEEIIKDNINPKEINLNDYVYNPFRNCYRRLSYFGNK